MVKRKTVMAREDLANQLTLIAKRSGRTLYDLVNEVFELLIRADEMGLNLRRIVEESWILNDAKKAGFTLGPEALWYEMAEIAYKHAGDEAVKCWSEAGAWLAKRYLTGDVEKPLEAFKRSLKASAWNIPEFTFETSGSKVSIRIYSPRFPESYTILYASFLESALKTFGYKTVEKEVSRGKIRLEALREMGNVEE